jgi:hypothetical protein
VKFERYIVLPLLLAVANAPAAERFAVVCEGTANFVHSGLAPKSMPTGKQVYVIDTKQHRLTLALEPRQEFDPICGADGVSSKADISSGIITAWHFNRSDDGTTETCSFELDRKNGHATYELSIESPDGAINGFKWPMDCERTEIPVFNTNGNKF